MSNTIRYIILLLTLWGVSMTVYSQSISLSHSDYSYTIHYECPYIHIINDTIECNGGSNYYHADKVAYRRNQYKKMIFFGYPSLMIHGNSVSHPRRMKEYNEAPETHISDINDLFNQIEDENIIAINLYSVSGKLLKEFSNMASIEQDSFARGLYILSIRTENNQYSIKYYG
ncbi:MAG: T9SS type A sorting domain-containing protein [Paludibacteraceae bacterium]|nr:T9SS type A sorting domain-containing protein [Paludibacteraceae bacterium]